MFDLFVDNCVCAIELMPGKYRTVWVAVISASSVCFWWRFKVSNIYTYRDQPLHPLISGYTSILDSCDKNLDT